MLRTLKEQPYRDMSLYFDIYMRWLWLRKKLRAGRARLRAIPWAFWRRKEGDPDAANPADKAA